MYIDQHGQFSVIFSLFLVLMVYVKANYKGFQLKRKEVFRIFIQVKCSSRDPYYSQSHFTMFLTGSATE